MTLNPTERAQLPLIRRQDTIFFVYDGNRWESAAGIYTGTDLRGYAWVEYRENGRGSSSIPS